MRTQIVVFDGVEELDALAPLEVLGCAAASGHQAETALVTLRPGRVFARYGTDMTVDRVLTPADADVVIVPGGGYANHAPQGTWAQARQGTLPAALRDAVRPGLTLASVCSGTMLLAAAGLTDGRPCTTHHSARDDLVAAGGQWIDARVVDDGDLVTSGGVTSGLDLALWLLERHLGPEVACDVERFLEYERRGTVWRPGG
ncbi:DJ-1/PfpI family protein [Microtetraspora sp. NBRC 13810]|uniref:DJ-1/PfpI family protein n=1 Tax=Microtetraspora sp. NBRC 13810 TaxID=3030990 RepID=UPI002556C141|nr:DJ-1/PfpI family protein [Microtetraspora sp. NBRC 13810]